MLKQKIVKVIAPRHWVNYLITGDPFNFRDEEDEKTCKRMARRYGMPKDIKDVGFIHNPDYGKPGGCYEYTFIDRSEECIICGDMVAYHLKIFDGKGSACLECHNIACSMGWASRRQGDGRVCAIRRVKKIVELLGLRSFEV